MKYVGRIKEVVEIESKQKGTPGLEISVEISYKRQGEDWVPIDTMSRRIWLYFPDDKTAREITLKKLATLGWTGGPIEQAGLVGKEVEIVSKIEAYNGNDQERFDFPLPERSSNNQSQKAKMKIDQILSAAAVPEVGAVNKPDLKKSGSKPDSEPPFETETTPATSAQDLQDEGDDLF